MSVVSTLDIYVSHVESDGPLLKLWVQQDRQSVVLIEQYISILRQHFDSGKGVPHPSALTPGKVCCARYSDGEYYRAKIMDLSNMMEGKVTLHFIDYGNSETVNASEIRLLEVFNANPLNGLPEQAEDFYLAGVVPSAGVWDDDVIKFIKNKISYVDMKGTVVARFGNRKMLKLLFQNEDFSSFLISQDICHPVMLQAQQSLAAQRHQVPLFAGFTVPPPMVQQSPYSMTYSKVTPSPISQLPPPPVVQHRAASLIFTSPLLDINSQHEVYVSYVEDGPISFSIQLKENEQALANLMDTIKSLPHVTVSGPLMPGSVCLGRYSSDKMLCRAVVTSVQADSCKVYYVDFGNSEVLPYSEIFSLPNELVETKVMALRFTLYAVKDLGEITDEVKEVFSELVTNKLLLMRVTPSDGPPLKQYCELFDGGENIKELIVAKMRERRKVESYRPTVALMVGQSVSVLVSFVEMPSSFYVQPERTSAQLSGLMVAMQSHCTGGAGVVAQARLHTGLPCCAPYSEDGQWYRALVLSPGATEVSVSYVDYGNTDVVGVGDLREISPVLAEALEPQAVRCCLKGFQGDILPELTNTFEQLVLDKVLRMVVVQLVESTAIVELYDGALDIGAHLLCAPQLQPSSMGLQVDIPAAGDGWTTKESELTLAASQDQGWSSNKESTQRPPRFENMEQEPWRKKEETNKSWQKRDHNSEEKTFQKHDREWEDKPSWQRRERDGEEKPWQKRHDGEDKPSWQRQARDGEEKPWQKRRDGEDKPSWQRRDRDGEEKPWQKRRDGEDKPSWQRQDRDGEEKPWQKRRDGEDKPSWQRRDRDGEEKPWQKRRDGEDKPSWQRRDRDGEEKPWQKRRDGEDKPSWQRQDRDGEQQPWQKRDDDRKWKSRQDDNGNDGGRGQRDKRSGFNAKDITASSGAEEQWEDEPAVHVQVKTLAPALYGDLTPPSVTLGQSSNVELVFIDSPHDFYVQVMPDCEPLAALMTRIDEVYGGDTGSPVAAPQAGTTCIAKYSEDQQWYRAVVQSVSGDSAHVLFPDFGNHEDVPAHELREMTAEFRQLPVQGVRCSLAGAAPRGPAWTDDEIASFTAATELKQLEATFVREQAGCFEVLLKDVEAGKVINEAYGSAKTPMQDWAGPQDPFPGVEVAAGTNVDVVITWFVNPQEFYCQLAASEEPLKAMMKELQAHAGGSGAVAAEAGRPVAVRFKADGVLYRARVETISQGRCVVQYVDYGNREEVGEGELLGLERRFLVPPRQALPCSLRGVQPADGGQWPLGQSPLDCCFDAAVLQCTFHGEEHGTHLVSLQRAGQDVALQLVSEGFAQPAAEPIPPELFAVNPRLLVGTTVRANVCYVESTSSFFVHLDSASVDHIQALVWALVEKGTEPVAGDSLVTGTMCVATPDEESWYRGEVTGGPSAEGVPVQFVDYGDQHVVPGDKVLACPKQLEALPRQAVACRLHGCDTPAPELEERFKVELETLDVILSVKAIFDDRLSVLVCDIHGKMPDWLESAVEGEVREVAPLCPLLVPCRARVWVSHVAGADSVWLQRTQHEELLTALVDQLFAFYETEGKGLDMEVASGSLCAAKSPSDGNWYRARVVSVESGVVDVLFLDYGNGEQVPVASVKALDDTFHVPDIMATRIVLPVVPVAIREELAERVTQLTAEKEFTAEFSRDGDRLLADLVSDSSSVCRQLIELGDASPLPGYSYTVEEETKDVVSKDECVVFVSFIESPVEFWVQIASDAAAIESLQSDLQSSADSLRIVEEIPSLGELLMVMFSDDSNWYRAKVTQVDGTKLTVCFVDYGNMEVVDFGTSEIKHLPENLKEVPHFATRCVFDLVPASGNEWSTEALERFENLVAETGGPFIIKTLHENEAKHVEMFVEGRNITDVLISEGLAIAHTPVNAIPERPTPFGSNREQVFVSHGTSPSRFWVQREDDSTKIDVMMERLSDAEHYPVVDEPLEVGQLVAAQHEDGLWYRASVLSVGDETRVLFVDYGNEALVSDVRLLPLDLLAIPALAKACRLKPPALQSEWSSSLDAEFEALAAEGTTSFEMEVEEKGDPMTVLLYLDGKSLAELLSVLCEPDILQLVTNESYALQTAFESDAPNAASSDLDAAQTASVDLDALQAASGELDTFQAAYDKSEAHQMTSSETDTPQVASSKREDAPKMASGELDTLQEAFSKSDAPEVASIESNAPQAASNELGTIQMVVTPKVSLDKAGVCVSYRTSPSEFWVQNASSFEQLERLAELLAEAETFPGVAEVAEGLLCAAKFKEVEQWYRARVLGSSEEGTLVLFVDYGNTAVCRELRTLPADLASWPALAWCCQLLLLPGASGWSQLACEVFLDITADTSTVFQVDVVEDDDPVIVKLSCDGKDIFHAIGVDSLIIPDMGSDDDILELETIQIKLPRECEVFSELNDIVEVTGFLDKTVVNVVGATEVHTGDKKDSVSMTGSVGTVEASEVEAVVDSLGSTVVKDAVYFTNGSSEGFLKAERLDRTVCDAKVSKDICTDTSANVSVAEVNHTSTLESGVNVSKVDLIIEDSVTSVSLPEAESVHESGTKVVEILAVNENTSKNNTNSENAKLETLKINLDVESSDVDINAMNLKITEADTLPEPETEADTLPEPETEADTLPEPETEADTLPEPETEADTLPELETEADTLLETEADTLPEPETEAAKTSDTCLKVLRNTFSNSEADVNSTFENLKLDEPVELENEAEVMNTNKLFSSEDSDNASDFAVKESTELDMLEAKLVEGNDSDMSVDTSVNQTDRRSNDAVEKRISEPAVGAGVGALEHDPAECVEMPKAPSSGQQTEHVERIVQDISVEMTTPSDGSPALLTRSTAELKKTPSRPESPRSDNTERILPGCVLGNCENSS
ncbi:tudor domain-containing 6-like isoform X2 [Bacillus rossius redtenbacheri]|uniref:tudor domain-containing 6-like isoform X2 n=1 Tax=Bacillus rossius redtenbacheri TaxID=93214 RepID=UPI002FDCEAA2